LGEARRDLPAVVPGADRLVVPVLSASREIPAGRVADALAAALSGAARETVAVAGRLMSTGVVVVDGLPAGALALAATCWPHAVPVLLAAFTPAGVQAAGGLLESVGPGVARRTVLAAVAPSPAGPPALAYALLHVTAGLAAAAVALPHPELARGRRLARSAAGLADAVRAVPMPGWPVSTRPATPWPARSGPATHPAASAVGVAQRSPGGLVIVPTARAMFLAAASPSPGPAGGGPVQNVAPSGGGLPGAGAVTTILAWTLWGSLVLCAVAAIGSGGAMAAGSLSRNPALAERGKATLLWSVIGAVVVGSAIALVNGAFGLGG